MSDPTNEAEMYDKLDEKIAEYDKAISTATDMLNGMKAQRDLLVTLRDTLSSLEVNHLVQRARVDEALGGDQ